MTERLLQFIWQFQYYNRTELQTENGELLQIIFPGRYNSNQGPDFLEAKIKIAGTVWIGSIELHICTSDWQKHAHDGDANYTAVILHVVWQNDRPVLQKDIPLVTLQHRVSKLLLTKYEEWMMSRSFVPCEKNAGFAGDLIWMAWKQRLIVERLRRKAEVIETCLQQNHFHWEETFWWLLARNFGYSINAEAFEAMARSVSLTILAKHKNRIQQLEALLMGQVGLLEHRFADTYPAMLQKEYRFLKKKYQLKPINQPIHFLRMRPGNFPTIRLAQLAKLVSQSSHLFSVVKDIRSLEDVRKLLTAEANDYWHYHYVFDEQTAFSKKVMGRQMVDNIVINTIVPVIFAFGYLRKEIPLQDRAIAWLDELHGERNSIMLHWQKMNIKIVSALDSQSLLELKTRYCDHKRCLECAVGNRLLREEGPIQIINTNNQS